MDGAFHPWNSGSVTDLNALRVFLRVAELGSFTGAARSLRAPKSSVSRAVAQLEEELDTRLFQRTTRAVVLTDAGVALRVRCAELLEGIDEALSYVADRFATQPRGRLAISAGIGFGVNVLSEIIPAFAARYPEVDVHLELTSRPVDLIASDIDVAIRMGPLPSSELVAKRLGAIPRYLCAAPSYLARRGTPSDVRDLCDHDAVDLASRDGRPRPWTLTKSSGKSVTVTPSTRIYVNDVLTIHRLVVNGSGIGCIAAYLAGQNIAAGDLVHLLPAWSLPPVPVSVVFPSNRHLLPTVRAFVDFLEGAAPSWLWTP